MKFTLAEQLLLSIGCAFVALSVMGVVITVIWILVGLLGAVV